MGSGDKILENKEKHVLRTRGCFLYVHYPINERRLTTIQNKMHRQLVTDLQNLSLPKIIFTKGGRQRGWYYTISIYIHTYILIVSTKDLYVQGRPINRNFQNPKINILSPCQKPVMSEL